VGFFYGVAMKAGTTELMKFKRLERSLEESKRGIVGLLELLWQGTARNAPRGNIGKFDNVEIAILCDWPGDPDDLVQILVSSGWLDESNEHRLLVHDWDEHCPKYIKGNLISHGKEFAIGACYKEPANSSPLIAPCPEDTPTKPSLAKPSLAIKKEISKKETSNAKPSNIDEVRQHWRMEGLCGDSDAFWDFYESKGWMVGKNPMKRWRRAASGWSRRSREGDGPPARKTTQTARRENNQAVLKRFMERHTDGDTRDDSEGDGVVDGKLATGEQRSIVGDIFASDG